MLLPVGWLYGKIADVRNALYDRGVFKVHDLGARTISIGNITTGGTGKTPLVRYVAEILADAGEKVCILTRGYGRENSGRVLVSDGEQVLVDARTGGDEPVELARKLIGKAIVVADADRVSAAKWAREKFGITAFVLDDGFQHRRAKRDLDIVCIDATRPFGPLLREPTNNLARADAIVVTRSDLASDISNLKSQISKATPEAKLYLAAFRITSAAIDKGVPALAFCGLGNPESFFELLRRNGYDIKSTHTFPDHHYYTRAEVSALERDARALGADVLLTTLKDRVKLDALAFEIPCHAIEIETELDDDEGFRRLVTSS